MKKKKPKGKKNITVNSAKNVLRSLVKYGTPHTLKITGSSTTVETKDNRYVCCPQFFTYGSLAWIRKVKNEILKNLEKQNFQEEHYSNQVSYFRFSELENGLNYDVVEIDLNKAYWYAALNHKIISKATFLEGMQVDKMVRLVALGSIASKKDISIYDGKKYTQLPPEMSKQGRSMFFKISKEIDELMTSIFLDVDDVLFYWCDAFFIKKQSASYIKKRLKAAKVKYKTVELESMYVAPHPFGQKIFLIESKLKEKNFTTYKERPFIKQSENQRDAYNQYMTNEFLTKKAKT